MHNVLTLRGALVRDARIWSRYLTEAITMFDGQADVLFASHHWPTWGHDNMMRFLSEQRDLYAYLHDQTLRLANQGHTGIEIAETIQLPPALGKAWHGRGYYGSVSHNVKAVYQRYLGWFDGNPANLWQHPPVETAKRYVDCFGGVDALLTKARDYLNGGDPRFAAQLLQHAVFADPDHGDAKELLAQVYEGLGHATENGIWRNFYLTGAQELRHGPKITPIDLGSGMAAALSVEQIFDTLAIRVDAPNAWHDTITIDWTFSDLGQSYRTTLRNGVLIQQQNPLAGQPDLSLTLTKPQLLGMLAGKGLSGIAYEGDPDAFKRLLGHLDAPDPKFAIVTP
jgi:alkyl sulfatase BDS1-like metallo-beta-lactamase superfamily hydrolase